MCLFSMLISASSSTLFRFFTSKDNTSNYGTLWNHLILQWWNKHLHSQTHEDSLLALTGAATKWCNVTGVYSQIHGSDDLSHQRFVSKTRTFDSLPHRHGSRDTLPYRRQRDWLLVAHSALHLTPARHYLCTNQCQNQFDSNTCISTTIECDHPIQNHQEG
ncbi:hypothetical protein GLYMA_11G192933v4 [Glycine max]|nr:hypothetical protein GLYMA_11G192933v4 [Glycine max]KAH1159350.1 hypothetical protein GYH30_031196 [Glycine max]